MVTIALNQQLSPLDVQAILSAFQNGLNDQSKVSEDKTTLTEIGYNKKDYSPLETCVLSFKDTDGDGQYDQMSSGKTEFFLSLVADKIVNATSIAGKDGVFQKLKQATANTNIEITDYPDPVYAPVDVNDHSDFGVVMGEMAFTNDVASRPVLATFGAGPCVIVAAYNPKTHEASMTHIDALSDIAGLWPLIGKIDGADDTDPIEVHISGGNHDAERAADIMRVLSYMNNVTIKSAHVDQSHGLSDAMAIDARTGNISSEFIPTNVDTPQGAMQGVENRLRSGAYTGKNSIVVAHNFIEDPIFEDIDKAPKPKAGSYIDREMPNLLKEMSDKASQLEQIKQIERSMNKGN